MLISPESGLRVMVDDVAIAAGIFGMQSVPRLRNRAHEDDGAARNR